MKENIKYVIIGVALIICACVLAGAITFRTHHADTISVTGLGETTFTSDLIVWQANISVDNYDKKVAYQQIEKHQARVRQYLQQKGIQADEITFSSISADRLSTSIYENGNYSGERFIGYRLSTRVSVTSNQVDLVENVSREITSLLAEDIDIDPWNPEYYYTRLSEVKQNLIEMASGDAYLRAQNVVKNAGAKLGKATYSNLGVFQITSATGDEEYSYGGAFNTSSKVKKARVTVRMTYMLK